MEGWILDLYPGKPGEMVLWLKTEEGKCVRLVDAWHPKFYVAGERKHLESLCVFLSSNRAVAGAYHDLKFVRLTDREPSPTLRVDVVAYGKVQPLIREIRKFGGRKYSFFNVDVQPQQMYLYEKGLFPLAKVEAEDRNSNIRWTLKDSIEKTDYSLPQLRTIRLMGTVSSKDKIPSFRDPIATLCLEENGRIHAFSTGSEESKILKLVEAVRDVDPDVVVTEGGDSFLLPYLARRALANGVADRLILGREQEAAKLTAKGGASYFSYGRIYFKPRPHRLLGRIHVDTQNAFMFADCGLEGLIEVARTCRIPLQKAANSTIGTSMTSAQLFHATQREVLIPWGKNEPENFKSAWDLLIGDRGGFYYSPQVGIHDNIGEVDFASMYPMLMKTRNISPETVSCECCPDSTNRVPELDYHICEKRRGLVPEVLSLLLEKREEYKQLRSEAKDGLLKLRYEQRQAALKWILVCSFGYLGFKNARFGKIDAHIAVCAFARDVLTRATHLAEGCGFELVHGIVDSLWLKRKGATDGDFLELCSRIEDTFQIPIAFEGRYRWIVFLPSRMHTDVPVLNRYYGVFHDGTIKVRGIEARRHDTSKLVAECQNRMIEELAAAEDTQAFYSRIPHALEILQDYVCAVRRGEVEVHDLLIERQLSKKPGEYKNRSLQAIAAKKLVDYGVPLEAGQTIRYLVTNADSPKAWERAEPEELMEDGQMYDREKCVLLLLESAASILSVFDYSVGRLRKLLGKETNLHNFM